MTAASEKAPSSVSQRGDAAEATRALTRGIGPGVPPSPEYGADSPAGLSETTDDDPRDDEQRERDAFSEGRSAYEPDAD